MNKRMRAKLDLTSPKQPGEVVYNEVQTSRIMNYFLLGLRSLRRIISVLVVVLLVALSIYIVLNDRQVDKLSDQQSEFVRTRTINQINSCIQIRDNQLKHNEAIASTQRLVTTVFNMTARDDDDGEPVDPEELQAFIDLLNIGTPEQPGLEFAKIPESEVRVCTAEALAEYNDSEPEVYEPYLNGTPIG